LASGTEVADVDQNTQKKTVLLVDDAPSNIQAANSILKEVYKIALFAP
jgi:phosphoserine phosphatase RsbU/P